MNYKSNNSKEDVSATLSDDCVVLSGEGLKTDDVIRVARRGARVRLTDDRNVLDRIHRAHQYIMRAVDSNHSMYGVTTAFGGMANVIVPREAAEALQNNIPWPHKTGAGQKLPIADVRATMLLRANSLIRGASGVRIEIIQRLIDCLNAGVTPHVLELGSIGASGDLVPLSYIAGSVIGLDPAFKATLNGKDMDCISALKSVNLPPLSLFPKEGLSLINGTSVMTGIAANCIYDTRNLIALSLGAHALFFQSLAASNQSFHPFVHEHKPHPGHAWVSERMRRLLEGSSLIREELNGRRREYENELEQDRYSLRCLPQYIGPIVDGFAMITKQAEIEMNSTSDNPLIDTENNAYYYCGNFLGQYIGMGMDQLRYYIGLLAKHIDVQIGLIVAPEFNNGLPSSLVGNTDKKFNLGFKGLQMTGNSIMPLLTFFGASLVDRFPTHAEQFNQNINSQGFGSANLARRSVELFQQYMGVALMFGVQAVDLRTRSVSGHFDAGKNLSPATVALYESILQTVGRSPSSERPYVRDDNEQSLDEHIMKIAADIAADGVIPGAVKEISSLLVEHEF